MMKNIALIFILLFTLTGCAVIDSIEKNIEHIEKISDHIDDTTNPNATSYRGFNTYTSSLNKPENFIEIKSLRSKRKNSVDKTMTALLAQGRANERESEVQQQEYAYQKTIEAQKYVKKYQQSAIEYHYNKEKISADNALKTLDKVMDYQKLNKNKDAENKLKLALLYLVNDRNALWLWQDDDELIFPDYLRWGDSPAKDTVKVVDNPDSLVFSGGGVKGTAYIGVLKYLQETDKLKNVKRFVGTSVGSIMCTFMSIGTYYESNRKPGSKQFWEVVSELMKEEKLINFIDNPMLKKAIQDDSIAPFTNNILHSIASVSETLDHQYALCDGTIISNFFKKALITFGLNENITLGELYKETGKHLILVSCSLSYRKAAYFDYKTAPDLPVVDAMRASMAFPFIFKPVKYNNDFFIDGGAVNNYPIDYFDNSIIEEDSNPATLGFILYSKNDILRPKWEMLKNPVDYTSAVFDLIMINTGSALFKKNVDRTVFIDCGKIDVMSYDMNKAETEKLIQAGYDAVGRYYNKKHKNESGDNESTSINSYIPENSEKNEALYKKKVSEKNSKDTSWYVFYPELQLLSPKMNKVYGVNLGIPFSNVNNVYGLNLGFIGCNTKNIYGIQISPIINNSKNIIGLGASFVNNIKNVSGVLLGVFNNVHNKSNSYAIQLGLMNNVSNESNLYAFQFAAINRVKNKSEYYKTDSYNGFQLALFNFAEKINGVQIGFFNKTNFARGIQVGLINRMDNSWIKYMPLINFSF